MGLFHHVAATVKVLADGKARSGQGLCRRSRRRLHLISFTQLKLSLIDSLVRARSSPPPVHSVRSIAPLALPHAAAWWWKR